MRLQRRELTAGARWLSAQRPGQPQVERGYSYPTCRRLLRRRGIPTPGGLANAILKADSPGARLAKEHKDSRRRIDAAVAAVTAIHRAAELADTTPAIYA